MQRYPFIPHYNPESARRNEEKGDIDGGHGDALNLWMRIPLISGNTIYDRRRMFKLVQSKFCIDRTEWSFPFALFPECEFSVESVALLTQKGLKQAVSLDNFQAFIDLYHDSNSEEY